MLQAAWRILQYEDSRLLTLGFLADIKRYRQALPEAEQTVQYATEGESSEPHDCLRSDYTFVFSPHLASGIQGIIQCTCDDMLTTY